MRVQFEINDLRSSGLRFVAVESIQCRGLLLFSGFLPGNKISFKATHLVKVCSKYLLGCIENECGFYSDTSLSFKGTIEYERSQRTETILWKLKMILVFEILLVCGATIVIADSSAGVTLNDIKELNVHCNYLDNCEQRFGGGDDLSLYTCDCHSICVEYNTCCLDSEYRNTTRLPTPRTDDECLRVYGTPDFFVYMIDKCKNRDIPSEPLCESSAEDSNDPFLMIPVTSSVTGKIYKNYFCALCNENINEYQVAFWDLQPTEKKQRVHNSTMANMMYDTALNSWVVLEDDGSTNTVTVETDYLDIHKIRRCQPMITACPKEWKDSSVKEKCEGNYMARIGFFGADNVTMRFYKNPHCALCNFENLSKYICRKSFFSVTYSVEDTIFVKLFILIDRGNKCESDQVYDRFAKKCRCNSREYDTENGKCVSRAL
ncbi:uncharacterized protein NPIL_490611 [Nephila pilipes]|uniref:SMB domain-containing protein n=1 Tax=Nephila pilipes TaxID=299642 RepID=A0A8X6U325_NEPPI|nr:uncharacterized protein NPIL_490611 [Nephila pilipes]